MNNKENKNCHDELLAQLSANRDNVEKLALSEINNLEFVIPIFSNFGSLNKYQFRRALYRIKKIRDSAQHLATLLAICVDTLTCMIKSSSIYDLHLSDNTVNLTVLQESLRVTYMVVSNSNDISPESMSSFIAILERSAARIQFQEVAFFNELIMYIKRLKVTQKLWVENQFERQLMYDSIAKNKIPVAGVSESNLTKMAPAKSISKNQQKAKKSISKTSNSLKALNYVKNSGTVADVPCINCKIVHRNPVYKKNCNKHKRIEKPAKQTKITDFSSTFMHRNEGFPQLFCQKDSFKPRKQDKRPMDDTNFVKKKENVQSPIKKLKLETNNVLPWPCYVLIERMSNEMEGTSRSVLKKK